MTRALRRGHKLGGRRAPHDGTRASFRRPNTAEEAASPRQPRLHLLGTLDTAKPRPKVHGPQPPGHGPRHARWRSGRRGRARGPRPVLARGDAVGLGALRGRHRTRCPRGGTHTPRRRRAGSAGSCQHRGDTADREEQQRRPTAPQPCLSAPRTKLEISSPPNSPGSGTFSKSECTWPCNFGS